ncbi:glycerophosphodiester phosphodiesterase [Halomonas sp. 328]|uniref:glycerophosphodiester phosphodiesterase n=1 Tax=Halomonas sp. 328 TaxID=2776704 RepID=UPI001E4266D6|nr:glycerophosphodiester phosphodiesterase [Halomonas sp. 328]
MHYSKPMISLLLTGCVGLGASGMALAEASDRQAMVQAHQAFAVIAHRGASGHAPEQTWPALEQALAVEADYLELDVQVTADGELVAFHDDDLARTTGVEGAVGDFTLAELQALDAGGWFNDAFPERADAAYAGARILSLDEIFARYGDSVRYYLETKSPHLNPGLEEALVERLEAHGLAEPERVLIQSFDQQSLLRVHELNADLPLVQLLWYYPEEEGAGALKEWTGVTPAPEAMSDADFQAIADYAIGVGTNLTYYDGREVIDADFVAQAQANDLLVHVYTINDSETMARLMAWGVDGLFTDFPDRLRALTPAE